MNYMRRLGSGCTVHAVTDVASARGTGERSFWITILLVGSSITIFQMFTAVRQFRHMQPKTRVEDVRQASMPFPKVLLCPSVRLQKYVSQETILNLFPVATPDRVEVDGVPLNWTFDEYSA